VPGGPLLPLFPIIITLQEIPLLLSTGKKAAPGAKYNCAILQRVIHSFRPHCNQSKFSAVVSGGRRDGLSEAAQSPAPREFLNRSDYFFVFRRRSCLLHFCIIISRRQDE
jgi:hypothetical protein